MLYNQALAFKNRNDTTLSLFIAQISNDLDKLRIFYLDRDSVSIRQQRSQY